MFSILLIVTAVTPKKAYAWGAHKALTYYSIKDIEWIKGYEDVKITKLVLTNATITPGAGDPSDSVAQIDLYKADKITKVATAYWSEGS
ncbi:MAG: hypothetical protein ACP5JL_09245, partial [bacterium]